MSERYVKAILKYLSNKDYQPLKSKKLARLMGVGEEDYGTFRTAVKRLRDAGRVVLGSGQSLTLPEMPGRVIGVFRRNAKGFGFVTPETLCAQGDLFIPPDATEGAMDGDLVVAVSRKTRRGKELLYRGRIVEILKRANNQFVGQLKQSEGTWFVIPDGKQQGEPILIRDVSKAGPKEDTKVLVEIIRYPTPGELPVGVIVETLGPVGPLDVETRAVILTHGLEEQFSPEALDCARQAMDAFDETQNDGREDLTSWTIVTIDPASARDYDDAISLERHSDESWTLGVHIADVSHFVTEDTPLDEDARSRATSVYFPRKVLPMLPEILSNGVCSLQEGQRRYTKSAFIRYNADGEVLESRVAETVICSTKRLTYEQAQHICDGKIGGFDDTVVQLVQNMETLARAIERRRREQGMLQLDLPGVDLVLDDDGNVIDAQPEDSSYSHTIIEMFMVEANEAVARLFDRLKRPIIRRVHPEPDYQSGGQLAKFVRAAGHKIARNLTRKDMQQLLEQVKGRPESYAVNMALLKSMQQAEYSPMQVGHFALASESYCHFTSPIRRYPDLTVHRMVREYCRGTLDRKAAEDLGELVQLAEHCTDASQKAEAAERELKEVLLLQLLADKIGETFDGIVSGVTNFGIFVELTRFGAEGLIRLPELGDDWWEVNARQGVVRGECTGRKIRIGDLMRVTIVAVDPGTRQLSLIPEKKRSKKEPKKRTR